MFSVEIRIRETRIHQTRILYPAKLSFKSKGEIKNFLDIEELREFTIGKHVLQKMLKVLEGEGNDMSEI